MTTIREATIDDAPAIASVHVASWRETYRGILPDDHLAGLAVEPRERMWRGMVTTPAAERAIFVAKDAGGRLVGFASGGPREASDPIYAPYTGELYAIYLLGEEHGRGTGRALVRAVASRLAERGMRSMLVWVLADNPSRRFYEALGGTRAGEESITIGGRALVEVAYGWLDTSVLLEQP
jgi:GNAT superfamily N-acetyltransferase